MRQSILIAFFLIFASSGLFFPVNLKAQALGSDIEVTISPENPGPNQSVYASVVSYSTNINTANITWKINGKTSLKGIGEKTFQFVTGDLNKLTTLEIDVITNEGDKIVKIISFKPVAVDLTWQTTGLTPPFFKGRTLFSHENKITFIAVPHMIGTNGREVSPNNLVYKWKLNGSVMDSDSGYGKSTYNMTGSIISRPLQVEVEVTSANTAGVGYAETVVNPIDPTVVLYRKSPLYGIEFQKALIGTVSMNDSKEASIIGMPYFFGVSSPYSPQLSYKWSINGISIDNDTTQTTRVFRQIEGTNGTSNISLSIENSYKILQVSRSEFDLTFGQKTAQ
ncbi:hypothetical protein H0W91_01870 [Patescibacteria group bacterium]|nr:hypothetical protein [Patescibacteria group bacterium]